MKRENWPKSEKQVDNARLCSLCSDYFVTDTKSDDPLLHIDYIPTVFALSLWLPGALRKRKSIDLYGRSQKHARSQDKKKKKKTASKNETALYVNVEDEHSVPDYVEQIKFEIVADKGTQTEELDKHFPSRNSKLQKKQVKQKVAQIKEFI